MSSECDGLYFSDGDTFCDGVVNRMSAGNVELL